MTDRDELIEIAWQAWLKAEDIHGGVVAVIDAVEQPIRADEREKVTPVFVSSAPVIKAMSDLRARVEALNGILTAKFDDGQDVLLWRSEVIALLKEDDRE